MADAQAPAAGAYKAGIICLGIACLIAAIPFPTFFLWTVFEFVALILAIVCLAQGRVGGGLFLLIGSLFVPGILAAIATFVFMAAVVGASAPHAGNASSSSAWTPAPKSTPAPFAPSQHTVEVEPPTAAAPTTPAPAPYVAPPLATQQIETWPAIDGLALGRTVSAKVGGNAAATIVVPLIAPRIRVRKTDSGRVTWASADLSTFLVTTRGDQAWLTTGSDQASTRPAITNKTTRLVGATATTAVWALESADRSYTAWPTTDLFAITKLTDSAVQATIPNPKLPSDVNAGNVTGLKISKVTVMPDGQLYVLWTFLAKDVSGFKRLWLADWYSAETGTATRQVPLFVGEVVANRDLVEAGISGRGIFFHSKTGYQVVDLATGTTLPLLKMPNRPRLITSGPDVISWKGGKTDEVQIVVADETGKILNTSVGKKQLIGTYHLTNGAYAEATYAPSTTPMPYDKMVWQEGPYVVQRGMNFWLVLNTATNQVLGAIEGDEFLGVQVTDSVIRVAVAASTPYEARVIELVKQ